MYIAHQIAATEANLTFLKQIGVDAVIPFGPPLNAQGIWGYEELAQLKEQVERAGLEVVGFNNIIGTPGIRQNPARAMSYAHAQDQILLAGPGRDAQIDKIGQSIRHVGKLGVKFINYGFTLTGVWRTERQALGRGGAQVTAYRHADLPQPPLTEAGDVPEEEMWDRFQYFLERVIPIAEEAGVGMACHPHDPPVPNIAGDPRILRSIAAYKRLVEMVPSPANGLNFCQGTIAEMGEDVIEAIRYFGSRNKIFNVHFRNIQGTAHDFQEAFLDDGDVDMLSAFKTYLEVGYKGPIVPDHFARLTVGEGYWGSWGHTLGYMQGMLRAVQG
ncbi:MAG: mannonate dehydratase [Litorilinea sp.]